MHIRAKFRVDAVFSIEGRGIVLQGMVVERAVASGMQFGLPGLSGRFVIGSVEASQGPRIQSGSVGLVLEQDAAGGHSELAPIMEGKTVDLNAGIDGSEDLHGL
ncbi:MAG: hypothetical protein KDM81_05155 [Verrucomicrobiae bacterium]|nr:hypothetical protein [Verrucomicrobiae bacterium]